MRGLEHPGLRTGEQTDARVRSSHRAPSGSASRQQQALEHDSCPAHASPAPCITSPLYHQPHAFPTRTSQNPRRHHSIEVTHRARPKNQEMEPARKLMELCSDQSENALQNLPGSKHQLKVRARAQHVRGGCHSAQLLDARVTSLSCTDCAGSSRARFSRRRGGDLLLLQAHPSPHACIRSSSPAPPNSSLVGDTPEDVV